MCVAYILVLTLVPSYSSSTSFVLQLDAIHEHLNNHAMERITWIIIGYAAPFIPTWFPYSFSRGHSLIVVAILVELVRPVSSPSWYNIF
jgi:hypothetical protein